MQNDSSRPSAGSSSSSSDHSARVEFDRPEGQISRHPRLFKVYCVIWSTSSSITLWTKIGHRSPRSYGV
jgi:hypothetical protein